MNDLFYRRIKRIPLFPALSGLIFGIAAFIENLWLGVIWLTPMFIIHTTTAFFLLTDKNKDHLPPLIFAELFSASLISSVQTALFSVSKGTERSFAEVTFLYFAAYIISAVFVLLLKQLVKSDDREPLGKLQRANLKNCLKPMICLPYVFMICVIAVSVCLLMIAVSP